MLDITASSVKLNKETKMRFIISPPVPVHIAAHWIIYPPSLSKGGIMIGDPYAIPLSFMDRKVWYLDIKEETEFNLDTIPNLIKEIEKSIDENNIIYITDSSDPKLNSVIDLIGCFLKNKFYLDSNKDVSSIISQRLDTRISSPIHRYGNGLFSDLIERYERPLKVIVCGDRNSSTSFKEFITFELRSLPAHSIVVNGGCKGIDSFAHKIAVDIGLEVRTYPANWDIYGKGAGPIRNKQMLTMENPDLVLAFHPDIEDSKGTKNMIMQSYNYINITTGKSPNVYIISLKRKTSLKEHFDMYGYGNFSNI